MVRARGRGYVAVVKNLLLAAFFLASNASAAVVQPLTSAAQLLIPAAGSTPGANGTFFRSDITIVNLATHDQDIVLTWLPQGASATTSTLIHIATQRALRSSDFVREILAQQGVGAILLTAVTGDGTTLDSTAALYAQSRIWTPQPGTTGTTSQSLPAIPVSTIDSGLGAQLFAVGGADNPAGYRVNIGILNLDPVNAQDFEIVLPGTIQALGVVVVPPMSSAQVPLPGSGGPPSPTQSVAVENITSQPARSGKWIAYGSTIDNVTGDAWSELAVVGKPPQ